VALLLPAAAETRTSSKGDLLITVAVGPKRRPVTFLVDTGAQITALSWVKEERHGISVPSKRLIFLNNLGKIQTVPMTPVTLWLLGEEDPMDTMVAVGLFQMKLLGMDVLKGKQWHDTQRNSWSFDAPQIRQLAKTPSAEVRLLQAAPALPPSKLTNVKPCPLPLGARAGTASVLAELREQGVVVPTHLPYNSPVWPVRKPNGKWRLTVDDRRLNANTGPLTAAVPNIAELISTIQEHAHSILATIDVKDMFFMVLLQPEDQSRFAFTWEGQQYTSTQLPQRYKHSPTLAHHALVHELEAIPIQAEVKIYQYIDNVLVGGSQRKEAGEMQRDVITHLESIGLTIPPERTQASASEVKFFGNLVKGEKDLYPPRYSVLP